MTPPTPLPMTSPEPVTQPTPEPVTEPVTEPVAGIRPLPRSLAPLPGESINGFLLRLSCRLDLSAARVAALTGLAPQGMVPAGRMLALDPATAVAFARAARLSTSEAVALTCPGWPGATRRWVCATSAAPASQTAS
jgi:hypothetical protein